MPFVESARQLTANLNPEEPDRLILDYLLDKGVGVDNVQPLSKIESFLKSKGVELSKEEFQQGLLSRSRTGEIFIGSNNKGFFLIKDESDAKSTADFYRRYIEAQETNLRQLAKLAADIGWRV